MALAADRGGKMRRSGLFRPASGRVYLGFTAYVAMFILLCGMNTVMAATKPSSVAAAAEAVGPEVISHRRYLHRIPELLYDLPKTSAYVRKQLDALGIKYRYPVAETGVIGEIGSGAPIILLRADMDALPILEASGVEFTSTHEGNMHACGHDAHTAMLLGAAKVLKEAADSGTLPDGSPFPAGTVRLVFQPAEEGGAGGLRMAEEGSTDGVSAAFGLHVFPFAPAGIVATKAGVAMAGSDNIDILVVGRGGHAGIPHMAADPVVAASAIVQALQALVSRETDPLEAAVISVTHFVAGDGDDQAPNVIPEEVRLSGTIRAQSNADMDRLRRRIPEVAEAVARAHGVKVEFGKVAPFRTPYPPLMNDPEVTELAAKAASDLFGRAAIHAEKGTMAGEDFAFTALRVPSTFAFLGVRNETIGAVYGVHTPQFKIEESALWRGVAMHVEVAIRALAKYAPAPSEGAGADEVPAPAVHEDL